MWTSVPVPPVKTVVPVQIRSMAACVSVHLVIQTYNVKQVKRLFIYKFGSVMIQGVEL